MSRLLSRALLASVLAVTSCALFHGSGPKFQPVSDADYGRLAAGQMAPVDAARRQVTAARDASARARLRLEEAEHEAQLAQADQTAARADSERSLAEQGAASSSKAPDVVAQAQEAAARAELRRRAAQAHAAYAQRLVGARQAEVEAADDQVAVREAELDRAKLTALSQADIPAATKYNPASFDARVADAQKRYQEARAKANDSLHQADQTHSAWLALNDQYQQRLQGPTAQGGTGAAAPLQPGTAPTGPDEAARAPAAPPSPPPAPPAPPAPQGTAAGQ